MQRIRLSLILFLLSAAAVRAAAADVAAGEWRQWRAAAFEKASTTAEAIDDAYRRAEALARVARAYAEYDDLPATHRAVHRALEAAGRVQEPAFRDWILHDVVLAQLRIDDVHGARETTRHIQTQRPQGAALAALADRELRSGDLKTAAQIGVSIRDPGSRGLVLRQIIGVHAARGELEPGYALLKSISDPFYQAFARADLAAAEVRAGRADRAHTLAARAPRRQRADVYSRIALERAAARDLSGASETLRSIDDELSAAVVQGRIAVAYAQAGEAALARAAFDAAIAVAMRSATSPRKARTLAQLARLGLAADDQTAASVLREARIEAGRLPPGEERDDALEYIASAQARAGDGQGALDTAQHVSDPAARALLVRDIVTLRNVADAESAAASVRQFEDPLLEAAALFGVLGVQSLHSGQSISPEVIDAARVAVRRIDAPLQPAALSALAAAQLRTGDPPGAAAIFREALDAAQGLERAEQRALAYVRIVDALNDRLLFLGEPPKPNLPAQEAASP
jgi:tetratricopeptide (TPR) repeat protein